MLFLDIGYLSDKGNKRKVNQDRILVLKNDFAALFVVADGMGGMESGEYASTFVVKNLQDWWNKNNQNFSSISFDDIMDKLYYEISNINNSLVDYCKKNNIRTGTTVSLLFMYDNYAVAAYSGDTRIYHIQNNTLNNQVKISQVSEDETLYNYYEKYENSSNIKNSERNKSILISYVGRANSIPVSFKKIDTVFGDIFIICTDGFYNYFNIYKDENINMIMELSAQEACENFIADIKKGVAADNLSAIFIKCM